MIKKYWMSVIGGLAITMMAMTAAHAADKVIVATFGDPIPAQMAAHDGKLSAATGWNVEWRKFNSGADVIAAMASGDVNIAEPNALIGFAGPRVIEQTVRETLPEGFQRSEFLLQHGAVDMIVDRREMRDRIARRLAIFTHQSPG